MVDLKKTDAQKAREAYIRQKVMQTLMGGGHEYEYETDIGRMANKYNEEMMRELL